jgi:hypothetical protein
MTPSYNNPKSIFEKYQVSGNKQNITILGKDPNCPYYYGSLVYYCKFPSNFSKNRKFQHKI